MLKRTLLGEVTTWNTNGRLDKNIESMQIYEAHNFTVVVQGTVSTLREVFRGKGQDEFNFPSYDSGKKKSERKHK